MEPGSRVEKPWGYEILVAVNEHYAMKEIVLLGGTRSSLQSHEVKFETILVLEGSLLLELEDSDGEIRCRTVTAGESYDVLPGRRHRVTAEVDVRLVEVSTPQLDDVIRHEDDYGRT
jgi:mannose-6-phosphate isomerase-like protein (cupin superfamily)